jgi:hypothetical protein
VGGDMCVEGGGLNVVDAMSERARKKAGCVLEE